MYFCRDIVNRQTFSRNSLEALSPANIGVISQYREKHPSRQVNPYHYGMINLDSLEQLSDINKHDNRTRFSTILDETACRSVDKE